MNLSNLTAVQLRRAAELKEGIASMQGELNRLLDIPADKPAPAKAPKSPRRKKHKMSAAGRAAIRAAQKARWAKIKAG
jgi:hypothetical protein